LAKQIGTDGAAISAPGKLHVLFVATVGVGSDGATGGQAVAATALFQSSLSQAVELELLSTAAPRVPPPSLPRRAARAIARLSRFVVRLWAADVVLVFAADAVSLFEKGLMCIVARLARRGVVLHVSGGNVPAQCERQRVVRTWLRWVLCSAHYVCVLSAYWTGFFSRYGEPSKIIEVSNGFKLGGPSLPRPPGNRLAFVGWVTREKGVFEALDVLAEVRILYPATTLTVVGGGRDLEAFTRAVEARGLTCAVRTTGWLSNGEVQRILRDSDVFLFPSHFEGLPNAVVEAMAAGLPVVATRVGGVPDLIRHGQSGFLADVGDVVGMAKMVGQLLAEPDLARELGRRGRDIVLERCDIERVWRQYAHVLHDAATLAGRGDRGGERA